MRNSIALSRSLSASILAIIFFLTSGAFAASQNQAKDRPPQKKSNPTAAAKATEQPLHSTQDLPVKPNIPAFMIPLATQLLSIIHQTNQMEIKAGEMAQLHSDKFQVREFGGLLIRDHTIADQMVMNFAKRNNIHLMQPNAESASQLPMSQRPMSQQPASQQPPQQPPSRQQMTGAFPQQQPNAIPTLSEGQSQSQMPMQTMAQRMQSAMVMMQQLQSLHGAQFDQKFLPFIQQAHENAIAMLSSADVKLSPSQFKNMLNKMLPILTQHYEIASHLHIEQAAKGLGGGE